jgi:tetratricopeptide (TPR) repeat protein/predicted amidohydrolase
MKKDVESNRYHRIALAQLSFNPAYVDPSGTSDVHEPVFPEDQFHGLHKVADIPEVAALRSSIAQSYLRHISDKIKSVAEFASTHGVEVLVLPEYSVPPEVLDTCRDLASRLRLVMVAGSHTVTQNSIEQYRSLGIPSGTAGKNVGRAICPVFDSNGGCTLFEKMTRSKWESEMVPGAPASPVSVSLNGDSVRLQVLICLDAIQDPASGPKRQFRDSVPTVLVIPALSPDTKLFHNKALLVLASGRCAVFANAAEYGGSRLYARAERSPSWFGTQDGTEPLPKGAEALVVADIDLAHQYEIRQSTNEFFPVRGIQVYPLIYADESPLCKRYVEFQRLVRSRDVSDVDDRRTAREFTIADGREFPTLMQDKLRHFLDHIDAAGLADGPAWKNWVDAAVVSTTESTAALRARLCSSAIATITQPSLIARYPSKVVQLTDLYAYLAKRYAGIMIALPSSSPVPSSGAKTIALAEPSVPFEPPFFDRETLLDVSRKSIEASAKTCQVVAGMRGIGKTSFAREFLKKVVLPTWKRVWIQVTEGMSFTRLLGEIAYRLDLKVPEDLPTDDVSRADVAQNVLLFVSQTPRIVVALDDFQYLLGPDRDFLDPAARDFLVQLIRAAVAKRNTLILTTTHLPGWPEDIRHLVDTRHVTGLDDKDSERLFSFWLRFEREDLSGPSLTCPDKVLALVHGHPLAVKLAAKMWAEQPRADLALFKRVREAMVAYVLDQVTLAPHEEEFLRFASVFRVPVKREAFVRWKSDEALGLLDSLLGQSLLEMEGDAYQLHPLVRDHYYFVADILQLRPLHKIAGMYFLEQYQEARATRASVDPEIVAEAVHHLLCAGERDKVREFGLYKHELRPVALMHYRKRSYDAALKEYRLLVELDPTDHDAHFHLSLIYANEEKWSDAEAHFGKAMQLKPGGYWVLQSYAHVFLRKNRELPRAEHLLRQAERLNPFHSYTLLDLGRLLARIGKDADAETYFRRAIDADMDNTRGYYEYARFLNDGGRFDEALNMAVAALESNPTDPQNKALVRELRQRVEDAGRGD